MDVWWLRGPVWLGVLLLAAVAIAGCGGDSGTAQVSGAPKAADFETEAVWTQIAFEVETGPRPAGSPQLQALGDEMAGLLPNGGLEPLPGEPGLRNVIGTLPGREPAIVVGAHYDTLAKPKGFVGANNGAAGSAIVIGVARALEESTTGPDPRKVEFVLFDGEEPAKVLPEESADFYNEGLRGSRAYVAAHPGQTSSMILLDYVAGRGLRLPREGSSDEELWERVVRAADTVGAGRYFSTEAGPTILDDHTPFLRSGVPAVDLIDWRYPGHSLKDGMDMLSKASVKAVGDTIVQLVSELREE